MQPAADQETILLVHPDPVRRERLNDLLRRAGFDVATANNGKEAIEAICARPPRCMIVRENLAASPNGTVLPGMKSDTIYGHLPIVVLVDKDDLEHVDWYCLPADDYLVEPVDELDLVSRVKLSIARIQRDVHANPLTGLPGNPSIMHAAEQRIHAHIPFALAHADLDSFKPFNDRYGFARGDEVIRMTARLLLNTVESLGCADTHVGHIGGDDFIFIVPSEWAETICQRFLQDFGQIIVNFYDPEDLERGGIASVTRKGDEQTFPIMTCSIGVIDTAITPVQHIGELSARVADVKSFAKKMPGSAYLIDRRKR
ncbi:MAG: diguanylate cyclase [FCB group bacterium]|nr:diguanylate cyclase [FCB group bacterium]